jgi:preprotein translocase subunit SecG
MCNIILNRFEYIQYILTGKGFVLSILSRKRLQKIFYSLAIRFFIHIFVLSNLNICLIN